jgi:hypothetical protein
MIPTKSRILLASSSSTRTLAEPAFGFGGPQKSSLEDSRS